MNGKMISAPMNQYIPKESAGKILFDKMNTFGKDTVALFEIKTGQTYTYGDLIEYSVNMAANLRNMFNIRKNDYVALISENSCKYSTIALASLYLATPLHLLNPGYTIYELRNFLEMSQPKLVFCSKSSLDKVKSLQKHLDFVQIIVSIDNNGDGTNYDDLVKKCSWQNFQIETDFDIEDQVAIVCNSSGTMGVPKGVMILHDNFRYNFAQTKCPELYATGPHCYIQTIPSHHIYGFILNYAGLYTGSKILIMDHFEPIPYLETTQNHRVDLVFVVPALAHFLANCDLTNNYDLSSVLEIIASAGAIPEQTLTKIKAKFTNLRTIHQSYGLTETSCGVFMTPSTETRPGSCGKVTPGHYVKVIDVKTKELLGPNCSGEICVKGGGMKGYLNDIEKTLETIDGDGFIHTGDVGYYDEDGFFYIIDRLKDLIKYKSFQVAPVEIEEILLRHVGIGDAAVVGKPDERCGELPVAFVVKRKGAEIDEREVAEYVAEQVCVEKRLHGGVRFVGEIPRNGAGKILRKILRDML